MLFTIVPDAKIIIRQNGVYRQTEIYTREGRVYAKHGSGFIGLRTLDKRTTVPAILWEHIEGVEFVAGKFDVMMLKGRK